MLHHLEVLYPLGRKKERKITQILGYKKGLVSVRNAQLLEEFHFVFFSYIFGLEIDVFLSAWGLFIGSFAFIYMVVFPGVFLFSYFSGVMYIIYMYIYNINVVKAKDYS